ncbi:MAG: MerR family transcriptional regulator, partial [Pseudomonadota bacterium]
DAFRTISEVAEWLGVNAHVLRFWESKFSQVKPVKRAGGRRYYRKSDMELLGGIKQLLHEDGLTIKGVQKVLREQGVKAVCALSPHVEDTPPVEDEGAARPGAPDAPTASSAPTDGLEAPPSTDAERAAAPSGTLGEEAAEVAADAPLTRPAPPNDAVAVDAAGSMGARPDAIPPDTPPQPVAAVGDRPEPSPLDADTASPASAPDGGAGAHASSDTDVTDPDGAAAAPGAPLPETPESVARSAGDPEQEAFRAELDAAQKLADTLRVGRADPIDQPSLFDAERATDEARTPEERPAGVDMPEPSDVVSADAADVPDQAPPAHPDTAPVPETPQATEDAAPFAEEDGAAPALHAGAGAAHAPTEALSPGAGTDAHTPADGSANDSGAGAVSAAPPEPAPLLPLDEAHGAADTEPVAAASEADIGATDSTGPEIAPLPPVGGEEDSASDEALSPSHSASDVSADAPAGPDVAALPSLDPKVGSGADDSVGEAGDPGQDPPEPEGSAPEERLADSDTEAGDARSGPSVAPLPELNLTLPDALARAAPGEIPEAALAPLLARAKALRAWMDQPRGG